MKRDREAMKRIIDVCGAVAGLLVAWPFMVIIGALVCLESPGGVFYRGVRTGKGGKPFRIWKFRTMVVDAEKLGGGSTAKDDPRVTRLGAILRKHKLDELPQFINVLTGEMSLVGPRPELPKYTDLYEGPEKLILSVKPGITDYASIEYCQLSEVLGRECADRVYEREVRPVKNALRIRYVQERSLRTDCRILLLTVRRLVSF
jgi:lipopolysaccharide/colanic/teichoic acid biosynthesis glycosyltransferase